MNVAYLLIGGNIDNRLHYLQTAFAAIEESCGTIVNASSIYETAAWGKQDQQNFLNQALELQTELPAHELLDHLLAIEEKIGRVREVKYGPRIIDIDILLFNDDAIDTRHLIVPHPELPNRRFALQPLADIAANRLHPISGKTINQLLKECKDPLSVDKFR